MSVIRFRIHQAFEKRKSATLQIGVYQEAIKIWQPSDGLNGPVENCREVGWRLSEFGLN